MLLFLTCIFAEYFKLFNTNKYIGLENGNLVTVIPERAVNIIRRDKSNFVNETILEIIGHGPVDFNSANFAIANAEKYVGAAFSITMAYNGLFVLICGEKCVFEINGKFVRGPCNGMGNFTYFEISPILGVGSQIYHHIFRAGIKDKSFNPKDPLVDNWALLTDLEKATVLIPYAKRLSSREDIRLDGGKDYERIFNFHPILD